MKKTEEQQVARDLFFQTDHSQAEIARQVRVEPKTVNLWVKHGKWREIKEATRRTPAILVEQYFTQLAELNNAIANREEGHRFATLKEAETMRKLIVCINSIQKQASIGTSIDVMQNLISSISRKDNDLAKKVLDYADDYLLTKEQSSKNSHFEEGEDNVEAHEEHSRSIVNELGDVEAHGGQAATPKCIQDPDDPYTFYWHKITQRKLGSPKYGKPPEGFREVPKKDPLSRSYGKGFSKY